MTECFVTREMTERALNVRQWVAPWSSLQLNKELKSSKQRNWSPCTAAPAEHCVIVQGFVVCLTDWSKMGSQSDFTGVSSRGCL